MLRTVKVLLVAAGCAVQARVGGDFAVSDLTGTETTGYPTPHPPTLAPTHEPTREPTIDLSDDDQFYVPMHNQLCPTTLAPAHFKFGTQEGKQACCLAGKTMLSMELAWDILGCTLPSIYELGDQDARVDGTEEHAEFRGVDETARQSEMTFSKRMHGFLHQNKPEFCNVEEMLKKLSSHEIQSCCNIVGSAKCAHSIFLVMKSLKAVKVEFKKCMQDLGDIHKSKAMQSALKGPAVPAVRQCHDAMDPIYRMTWHLIKATHTAYVATYGVDGGEDVTASGKHIGNICDPEDFSTCPTRILKYFEVELRENPCQRSNYPNIA